MHYELPINSLFETMEKWLLQILINSRFIQRAFYFYFFWDLNVKTISNGVKPIKSQKRRNLELVYYASSFYSEVVN